MCVLWSFYKNSQNQEQVKYKNNTLIGQLQKDAFFIVVNICVCLLCVALLIHPISSRGCEQSVWDHCEFNSTPFSLLLNWKWMYKTQWKPGFIQKKLITSTFREAHDWSNIQSTVFWTNSKGSKNSCVFNQPLLIFTSLSEHFLSLFGEP